MIPLSIQPEILKRGAGVGEGETVSVSPATRIVARQSASEKIKRCFINEARNQRFADCAAAGKIMSEGFMDSPQMSRARDSG